MTTIGDPMMELGGFSGYWLEAEDPEEMQLIRMLSTNHEGTMKRREVANFYARLSDRSMQQ